MSTRAERAEPESLIGHGAVRFLVRAGRLFLACFVSWWVALLPAVLFGSAWELAAAASVSFALFVASAYFWFHGSMLGSRAVSDHLGYRVGLLAGARPDVWAAFIERKQREHDATCPTQQSK